MLGSLNFGGLKWLVYNLKSIIILGLLREPLGTGKALNTYEITAPRLEPPRLRHSNNNNQCGSDILQAYNLYSKYLAGIVLNRY